MYKIGFPPWIGRSTGQACYVVPSKPHENGQDAYLLPVGLVGWRGEGVKKLTTSSSIDGFA